MEKQKISNTDRFISSFSYLPFIGIILFFKERDNKSSFFKKHNIYGNLLFFAYVILKIILVSILSLSIGGVLLLVYIIVAGITAYKVYNGEDVNIEYIDKIEKKVSDKIGDSFGNINDKAKKDDKKEKNELVEMDESGEIKMKNGLMNVFANGVNNAVNKVKNERSKDEFAEGNKEEEVKEEEKKPKNKDILDF